MGLTESKIKDLHDKKFDDLYKKHKTEWDTMVDNAFEFAKKHIAGGATPRADDVLKALLPMLEVNELLRKHQEDNRARFKRFREYFGDYIIDQHLGGTSQEKKK
jgi:hypothetical protein